MSDCHQRIKELNLELKSAYDRENARLCESQPSDLDRRILAAHKVAGERKWEIVWRDGKCFVHRQGDQLLGLCVGNCTTYYEAVEAANDVMNGRLIKETVVGDTQAIVAIRQGDSAMVQRWVNQQGAA